MFNWDERRKHYFGKHEFVEVGSIAKEYDVLLSDFLTDAAVVKFMTTMLQIGLPTIQHVQEGAYKGTWFESTLATCFISHIDPQFHLQMIQDVVNANPNWLELFERMMRVKNN